MEVKIFRDQSLNKIITEVDNLEEWQELCKELDMTSQYELSDGTNSPIPYPHMNSSYKNLIDTLCPNHCDYKDYSKTTIPLEVLREIKLCTTESYFGQIDIRYDDKSPDPFVIGKKGYWYGYVGNSWTEITDADGKKKKFTTKQECIDFAEVNNIDLQRGASFFVEDEYIIAKFGDHDKSWEELKEIAIQRLVEKYGSTLKKEISQKQDALKHIKENALLYLNAEISERELEGRGW